MVRDKILLPSTVYSIDAPEGFLIATPKPRTLGRRLQNFRYLFVSLPHWRGADD